MNEIPIAHQAFPFIVARGRSGTTLLRAMLDAHPDMAIPGESHFVVQFARRRARYERDGGLDVDRFAGDLLDHWAFKRWDLPSVEVLGNFEASPPADYPAAIRSLYATYARHHRKARYGDKTPSYVLHIDLLATTFPDAVFVHLIRDGRDVALSYLDTDFGSRTLGQAAIYWDRYVRAGRAAGRRIGPERYREVRYEDLIREPDRTLHELCTFIGLPFDATMLAYYQRASDFVPALSHKEHHLNLYKPPTIGLRDWRRDMSHRDAAIFDEIAGELLDELGYDRTTRHRGVTAPFVVTRLRVGTQFRRAAHATRIRGRKLRKRIMRRATRRGSVEQRPGHLSL